MASQYEKFKDLRQQINEVKPIGDGDCRAYEVSDLDQDEEEAINASMQLSNGRIPYG